VKFDFYGKSKYLIVKNHFTIMMFYRICFDLDGLRLIPGINFHGGAVVQFFINHDACLSQKWEGGKVGINR
jgi:hypothetical protein